MVNHAVMEANKPFGAEAMRPRLYQKANLATALKSFTTKGDEHETGLSDLDHIVRA